MDDPIFNIDNRGTKRWRLPNRKYHRLDGPAIEWADGEHWWFINGIDYSFKEYLNEVKSLISDEAYFILVLTYGDTQ